MIFIFPIYNKKRRDSRKMRRHERAKKLGKLENMVLCHGKGWNIDDVKSKKNNNINKILISINVIGGSGPLTILVNEDDVVCDVIEKAIKSYTRQGRLPVLGSDDVNDFVVYCSNDGTHALSPSEPIGSFGTRKFVLCENQSSPKKTEPRSKKMAQKGSGSWKSFSFKKVRSALECVAIGGRD